MSKKAGKARKAVKKLHRRTSPRLAAPAPKPTKTSTAALLSALPLAPAVPSAASDDVKTEAATLPARQALAQGTTAPVPHESVSENVAAAVQMRTKPAEAAPEAGVEEVAHLFLREHFVAQRLARPAPRGVEVDEHHLLLLGGKLQSLIERHVPEFDTLSCAPQGQKRPKEQERDDNSFHVVMILVITMAKVIFLFNISL